MDTSIEGLRAVWLRRTLTYIFDVQEKRPYGDIGWYCCPAHTSPTERWGCVPDMDGWQRFTHALAVHGLEEYRWFFNATPARLSSLEEPADDRLE